MELYSLVCAQARKGLIFMLLQVLGVADRQIDHIAVQKFAKALGEPEEASEIVSGVYTQALRHESCNS